MAISPKNETLGKISQSSGSRNLNLDLIRCAAVLSVVSVHFFLNTGYYGRYMVGKTMLALTFLRTCFMVCVPLFALLTGYLNCHKKLSRGYFRKLIPLLLSYLLCAILALCFRSLISREAISLTDAILSILKISDGAISYAWYIEMYIGLFLLIPFLNILYAGLETKGNKQTLLLVMGILTVLPNAMNIHNLTDAASFLQPPAMDDLHHIFPSWWTTLWPVTYYFLGAYIREYDIRLPGKTCFLLLVTVLGLSAAYTFYRSYGSLFFSPFGSNWGGIQCTVSSVLLFLWILHLDLSFLPRLIQKLIGWISRISLCIYLCSSISDPLVYSFFDREQIPFSRRILWAPAAIAASFSMAALLAQTVLWIQAGILRLSIRKPRGD